MEDLPAIVYHAWHELGDARQIRGWEEVSANVSTNQVFRLFLSDESSIIVKTSSYGSYYLFVEDHDRIDLWRQLLAESRFRSLLADALRKDNRVFISRQGDNWAIFYHEAAQRERLPRVLDEKQIVNLAEEMAYFHKECRIVAPRIPLTSRSIKSDVIHLHEQLRRPQFVADLGYSAAQGDLVRRHCLHFLDALLQLNYDYWQRLPLLIDWNLGNFSVSAHGDGFRLYSRWDYDWFRMEPPCLDFYFCSRVCSAVGDRTEFSYFANTLTEERFLLFLRTYHWISPLREADIQFLRECYRFFILNYVIRQGAHFFKSSYCERLRREAVEIYLPQIEELNLQPIWTELKKSGFD